MAVRARLRRCGTRTLLIHRSTVLVSVPTRARARRPRPQRSKVLVVDARSPSPNCLPLLGRRTIEVVDRRAGRTGRSRHTRPIGREVPKLPPCGWTAARDKPCPLTFDTRRVRDPLLPGRDCRPGASNPVLRAALPRRAAGAGQLVRPVDDPDASAGAGRVTSGPRRRLRRLCSALPSRRRQGRDPRGLDTVGGVRRRATLRRRRSISARRRRWSSRPARGRTSTRTGRSRVRSLLGWRRTQITGWRICLGADPVCFDAARILRPPATWNHKRVHAARASSSAISARDCVTSWRRSWSECPSWPAIASHGAGATSRRDRAGRDPLLRIPPPVYVGELLGVRSRRGAKVQCPFHRDEIPSLHVYATAERGWSCFSCGRGGSIYDLAAGLWGYETRGRDFVRLRTALLERFTRELSRSYWAERGIAPSEICPARVARRLSEYGGRGTSLDCAATRSNSSSSTGRSSIAP